MTRLLQYQRARRSAWPIVVAIVIAVVAGLAACALALRWFGPPFLIIFAAMAVVGALVGWFSFHRLGLAAFLCVTASILAPALLFAVLGGEWPPVRYMLQAAIYDIGPYAVVCLLPALVGGLVAAVVRREIRAARP